jgi:hypothetical protein
VWVGQFPALMEERNLRVQENGVLRIFLNKRKKSWRLKKNYVTT